MPDMIEPCSGRSGKGSMVIFRRIHAIGPRGGARFAPLVCLSAALALGLPVCAEPKLSLEAGLAVQVGSEKAGPGQTESTGSGLAGQIRARASDTFVFPSGVEIGWSAALAARFGPGAKDGAGGDLVGPQTDRSPFTQFGLGPLAGRDPYAMGTRAALDEAYLFVTGGWGEAVIGRDMGVGERFSLPIPDVLGAAGAADARLSRAPGSPIVLDNALSGQSAKVSLLSPRLIGFRLGASFTPALEKDLLDPVRFSERAGGPSDPGYENMLELAGSFSRRFSAGYRLSLSLTQTSAQAGSPNRRDLESTGWGMRIEWADWTIGVSSLEGKASDAAAGYSSNGAGITRQINAWTAGLSWAEMADRPINLKRQSVALGVSRPIADALDLSIGLTWDDVSGPVMHEALGLRVAMSAAF
jgi:hypothetical protein